MRRLIEITLSCLVLSSPLLASEFAFEDITQPLFPATTTVTARAISFGATPLAMSICAR